MIRNIKIYKMLKIKVLKHLYIFNALKNFLPNFIAENKKNNVVKC